MELVDKIREKVGEALLWAAAKVAPNPLPEDAPDLPDTPTIPDVPGAPDAATPEREGAPRPDLPNPFDRNETDQR